MLKPFYEQHVDDGGYIYFQRNVALDCDSHVVLHVHNAVEFKFIMEGNYQIDVGGEKRICQAGDIVFVDSRRPHSYRSVGKSTNFVLVIGKEIVNDICGKGKIFPLYMPVTERFNTDIGPILEETFAKWKEMDNRKRLGFVYRLIGTIVQYYDLVEDVHNKKEDFIAEILEYIEDHFNEDITLDTLSKEFGYSKNYFSNIFNRQIKMSLRECVNRCRVNKALAFMEGNQGEMPLWRIAELCGYTSMNTFRRAIKKYANDESRNES